MGRPRSPLRHGRRTDVSWRGLIARGNDYFDQSWRSIWFQPVLYLFLFGAGIRLAVNQTEPPPFTQVIAADGFYELWLALLVGSPPAAAVSWWLIFTRRGRFRYAGMWLRLSADLGVFVTLLTYHLAVIAGNPATESRIFSRYVVGAVMLFTVELIVRDVWALAVVEARARVRR